MYNSLTELGDRMLPMVGPLTNDTFTLKIRV